MAGMPMRWLFAGLLSALALLAPLGHDAFATPRSLVDSDGRSLRFDTPFTRIISLYPAHTVNLVHLGLAQHIVAVGSSDEQLRSLPRLRFQDDPERLLALKPDLVLIRPMISRSYPNLVSILEQNGVRVVSLQPDSLHELFAYWRALAALGGVEQRAEAMITAFENERAALQKELNRLPAAQRKRVFFESIHRQMKTFSPDSMAIFVLENAGGINAAADARQLRNTNIANYGKERILAKAEEIDVYLAQNGRMNPVSVAEIENEPGFEAIKAVRDKQVFLVDETLVSRPTPELLQAVGCIRALLYPDFTQQECTRP